MSVGPLVQPGRGGTLSSGVVGQRRHLAHERPDRPAQLQRAADRLALPERHARGLARRGGDDDPVVGDVLHPPARGAEQERVADPRLVDHLLVELADPRAGAVGPARRGDREQAAVGDRAARGDGEPLRTRTALQLVGDAIPRDPGPQLAELLGRVAPGQHVQHRVQRGIGQRGERGGPAHDPRELVERPWLDRHHRHDLLRQDVERVARVAHRLDRARRHPFGDDRAGHQVAPVLGEDDAAGHRAHLVARPSDPLQPGRDAGRRLHLHDEVDRAHVDAQLQAGRGHDAGQQAGLELLLDQGALLAGHRPVVRLRHRGRAPPPTPDWPIASAGKVVQLLRPPVQLLGRELVEPRGEPLGQPAGVGEHDRGAVGADQLEQPPLHGGPDRRPLGLPAAEPMTSSSELPGAGRSSSAARSGTGTSTLTSIVFGMRRLHHLDRTGTGEERGHLVDRAHGGREPDPLGGLLEQLVEALQ